MSGHDIGINFNISELLAAVQTYLVHEKPILDRLNISLQAIAKRKKYCQYHFSLFQESTSSVALLKDRLEQVSYEELSVRDVYEANSIAFLQSLHAMIDSFPYTLNLIYQKFNDVDSRQVGWNKEFIKHYKRYNFFSYLQALFENETFCQLKGYSNHGKHKYPIRIKNTFKELIFEDFTFEYGGMKVFASKLKVESFMTECHDRLIPKFFYLIKMVQEDVITS
ncbi:hypothetical protein [Neptunicella sp.]|uniref:hypothetical protein n=1 Tax=Neptunicella sp. TaxID=2125986 RepID=UPI003F68CD85